MLVDQVQVLRENLPRLYDVQSRLLATPFNDLAEVRHIVATLLCINRDLVAQLEGIEAKQRAL